MSPLSSLRDLLGDAHVLTDADLKASYETDWTRRYHGSALAVAPLRWTAARWTRLAVATEPTRPVTA